MRINLTIISDSNLELLKRSIESRNNKFIKKVFISPYGQLYQSIYEFKEDLNNVIFGR